MFEREREREREVPLIVEKQKKKCNGEKNFLSNFLSVLKKNNNNK